MECCGNTIKDLYGFSCPLKCSTYILQSVVFKTSDGQTYYIKFIFTENNQKVVFISFHLDY